MGDFLILKLQGMMQAWGGHTFEDYRPTEIFPTRSGLVGLLGACLGLDRANFDDLRALSDSFAFAVRSDRRRLRNRVLNQERITDFHTVLNVRKVGGKVNENPVVSRREYLCDAEFTVALRFLAEARFQLGKVCEALRRPHFTPFLGRRCCPPGRPLFEAVVQAERFPDALNQVAPQEGTIYSEDDLEHSYLLPVRDVPVFAGPRQFETRTLHVLYVREPGGENVPQ